MGFSCLGHREDEPNKRIKLNQNNGDIDWQLPQSQYAENPAIPTLYFSSLVHWDEPDTFIYSQIHKAPFYDAEIDFFFNCNEQWCQYKRAVLAVETGALKKAKSKHPNVTVAGTEDALMKAASGVEQIRIGGDVELGLAVQAQWEQRIPETLLKVNWMKFAQNPDEREWLLSSGDRELVYASKKDKVYGIGFKQEEAPSNRAHWGLNLLGHALMDVRGRLRQALAIDSRCFALYDSHPKVPRLLITQRCSNASFAYTNNTANTVSVALSLVSAVNTIPVPLTASNLRKAKKGLRDATECRVSGWVEQLPLESDLADPSSGANNRMEEMYDSYNGGNAASAALPTLVNGLPGAAGICHYPGNHRLNGQQGYSAREDTAVSGNRRTKLLPQEAIQPNKRIKLYENHNGDIGWPLAQSQNADDSGAALMHGTTNNEPVGNKFAQQNNVRATKRASIDGLLRQINAEAAKKHALQELVAADE